MLGLFRNNVPAELVIGPVKVFVPVNVNVPVPFLVRPPFALPASNGTEMVTLLLDESTMAPPARIFAWIPPENQVVVCGEKFACKMPPLKLKTALVPRARSNVERRERAAVQVVGPERTANARDIDA